MATKLKGEAFWNKYVETSDHCDHDCDDCPMYLVNKKMCIHESLDRLDKWNAKKRKERVWNVKNREA